MTSPRTQKVRIGLPKPANDNEASGALQIEVVLPNDLPITQVEIEVFALLLDDLTALAANENEEEPE
jgi:hypothetical protein